MTSSSFMNQWESRMIFSPMEFRMRILMPNEILKMLYSLIKLDDNPNDEWNWKTHPLPNLGHLDGVLEFHHDQFRMFDFNILHLHPNYFKLRTIRVIYR
jgi:hypothetical protein